ncbi:hypothetical protein Unana1_07882 [Umbelopsis nana]
MARPSDDGNPTEFLQQLEDFLFSECSENHSELSRAPCFENELLASEAMRYKMRYEKVIIQDFDVLTDSNVVEPEDEDTNGWRSSEAIQAIEHSIQKQAEAIVDMCVVGCIQRDDMAWVTIDQNATLSEKLKWAENVIQLQKLDLERKRHERSMMRQQLIIHYADYFETFYKAIRVMAELLKEATLSKEFQRFRVFEKYMAALAESLTLKLSVLDATVRVNTYDQDTVRALKVIRSSLETQHTEINQKIEEIQTKIEAYNSQGSDFREIAKAYAQAIARIKDTKEHIARISSTYA